VGNDTHALVWAVTAPEEPPRGQGKHRFLLGSGAQKGPPLVRIEDRRRPVCTGIADGTEQRSLWAYVAPVGVRRGQVKAAAAYGEADFKARGLG
jgi:hypothetical protein